MATASGALFWVCTAILIAALAVVRHADVLAERSRAYGT
jgi:Ca2+/H+ antiporter